MVNEEILRAKAAKKKLSIMALEKEAGLGNGVIGKWFTRECDPSVKSLKKVADVLGCKIDALLVKEDA